MNMKPRLDDAIAILQKKYADALKQDWIKKPLSYAIYYTWKEIELKEKCSTPGEHQ